VGRPNRRAGARGADGPLRGDPRRLAGGGRNGSAGGDRRRRHVRGSRAIAGRIGLSDADRADDAGGRIAERLADRQAALLDETMRRQREADLAIPPTGPDIVAALQWVLVDLGGSMVDARTATFPGPWLTATDRMPPLQQITFGEVAALSCQRLPASYLCDYALQAEVGFVQGYLDFIGTWRAEALNASARFLDDEMRGTNEFVKSGGIWSSPTARRELEAVLTGGASLLR
jgi:hypothetical protein